MGEGERLGLLHGGLGQDGVDPLGVRQLGVVPLLSGSVNGGCREDQQALQEEEQ